MSGPLTVDADRWCWPHSDAMNSAEIVVFKTRLDRVARLGYRNNADRLAGTLLARDRDADDRRLCVECSHAGPGRCCSKREAFMLEQLQRCPAFKEITT